ncbi:protein Lines homolog 1 [Xiphophorus maculatus]|uniref:Lines homolog 1 n=1 Tax=Xiphophorus maculatus TaxID=8083 RepID=M3ZGB7_XIPMA|nr:protein Lines homolog 1 [Xiphophorus maculatus]
MDVPQSPGPSSIRELSHCYRALLGGACPKLSGAEVARLLFSGVCGQVPERDTQEGAEAAWELIVFSLTLLRKICCGVSAHSLHGAVRGPWRDILSLLFDRMDLMSQLVLHFQSEDQVISHLAAKSASVCVLYLISTSGAVSPVWQKQCVQAFSSSPPGPELDACLWSLTEVIKKLLKQSNQVLLAEVLAAFDCSLTALCSKLLPEERTEVGFGGSWRTTFCLLLDLLEVLTASGLVCGAGLSLRSQRIPAVQSAALLLTVSCCSDYFVKKRILLLLKRVLLQKLGEDWSLEGAALSVREHRDLRADRCVLTQCVLQAVAADWLQSLQVERAVFFGGREKEGLKPDGTMLRAVSLVLLKSIELHLQTAAAAGVDRTSEVDSYLQSLWSWLRRLDVSQTEVSHSCSWISLLFGEQDDDLMEASSASLSIFLSYRRCSGWDSYSVLEGACASGCNPHCHFVLLLQSLSFDHSILLDFLISSETCFLEYFVRYLKYLRGDWRGFAAACGHRNVKGLADAHGCERGEGLQPGGSVPPLEGSSSGSGLRLVEYDSSDESSEETPDGNKQSETTAALTTDRSSKLKTKPSLSMIQSEKVCPTAAAVLEEETCDVLDRVVSCLSELRQVVMRLQTKQLFPYNPSSLLKLLAQVENCYQRSPLS